MVMLHGVGVLLLTAAAGYWVLERAMAHKGQMKQVGLFLGGLLIVASLVAAAAQVWSLGAGCKSPGGMMGKKAGWCPMMSMPEQEPVSK